jgi:homoserine dehydrogenase
MDAIESRYYLRMVLQDKPGIFGVVATILGEHGISLASVLQKDRSLDGQQASVVIVTHRAVEKNVMAALRAMEERRALSEKPVWLRIEDPGSNK